MSFLVGTIRLPPRNSLFYWSLEVRPEDVWSATKRLDMFVRLREGWLGCLFRQLLYAGIDRWNGENLAIGRSTLFQELLHGLSLNEPGWTMKCLPDLRSGVCLVRDQSGCFKAF